MSSQHAHKRRKAQRIGALTLAGILVLAGCAPAGRDEACDAMRSFSRSVESVQNYAQLEILASRLSEDLYEIARQAGNRELRNDIGTVAVRAQSLAMTIQAGRGPSTMSGEINGLADRISEVQRWYYC